MTHREGAPLPKIRRSQAEWWDDEAPYEATSLVSGSVYAVDGQPHDEAGFYLPNGEWHALPKRRLGF